MPDYFNARERNILFRRIEELTPDSVASGSRITGHQVIRHLNHSLRELTGEIAAAPRGNVLTRAVVKWLIFSLMPWPEKLPKTEAEIAEFVGPLPAQSFEADHAEFVRLLKAFEAAHATASLRPHPVFGALTGEQWGRYLYLHIDYHLATFGIHGDYFARP
jgi:hypothetical protein